MIGGNKLSEKIVYEKYWMKVKLEDHEINEKGKFEFVLIEAPDWAIIVPETSDGDLLMVKQYRPGWNRVSLEFPAGRIEQGENLEEVAIRELREETGYIAKDMKFILNFRPIVWTNQLACLYFAKDLDFKGVDFDDQEQIQVMEVSPNEIEDLIQQGEIIQGSTIMAYYSWKSRTQS